MTYGIKIAKPGKSVHSTDMRDLSVDMNTFSMFKLHSTQSTTVTLNAGDSEASTTISHGLGYVPAFLVYYKRSDESVERLLPDIPFGVDPNLYPWAYATNTGVTVGYAYNQPYNQIVKDTFNTCYTSMGGGTNSFTGFGKLVGPATHYGGFQYQNVVIANSTPITSASLEYTSGDGDDPPGNDTKVITYGIDKDTCPDFGSDMGYDKTTASTAQNVSTLTDGQSFGINVTGQVQEIINRAGWTSGNNMGFYTFDNGTSETDLPTYKSTYGSNIVKLTITLTGSLTISFRVIIFKDKIAD